MKIVSVNIARVGNLFVPGDGGLRRVDTGIHKQPVAGPVPLTASGLAGDEQADRSIHGGRDKAVYAYPVEHYPFWEERRAEALTRFGQHIEPLAHGSMGENLTMSGLVETEIWIGDRLVVGDTGGELGGIVLEVTEPRLPCYKFNVKIRLAHAAKLMLQSGYSGFYLRVLKEGVIRAGDVVTLVPGVRRTSVASVNDRRRTGFQPDLF